MSEIVQFLLYAVAWYAIGFMTYVVAYGLLIRKDYISRGELLDGLLEVCKTERNTLLVLSAFGPIPIPIFLYWWAQAWYDSLPINDDGTKDFPWSKDV